MNIALKRTFGFTLLILLIAGAVWVIVYFGNPSINSADKNLNTNTEQASSSTKPEFPATSTLNTLVIGVEAGDFLPNPFLLPATSSFINDRDWVLEDKSGAIIASSTIPGLISSYSAFGDVYWYDTLPTSNEGILRILESDIGPQIIIPVKLQIKTQTLEIYFRNAAMSNCGTVIPVKRTVVSTGENDLYYYESALRELLKGPTQSESDQALITMIPKNTKVIRVGKNEKGRYVADFTRELKDPTQIDCFWSIAKNQIQKTLSTVPLPGTTLEGVILIEGEAIE